MSSRACEEPESNQPVRTKKKKPWVVQYRYTPAPVIDACPNLFKNWMDFGRYATREIAEEVCVSQAAKHMRTPIFRNVVIEYRIHPKHEEESK